MITTQIRSLNSILATVIYFLAIQKDFEFIFTQCDLDF